MPRIRGPKAVMPAVENLYLLNHRFFGSHERGGKGQQLVLDSVPVWSEIFRAERPLVVEIGFNRGRFITEYAHLHPEHSILGIEIQRRFCWRLANLMENDADAPHNLRVVWGDAKEVTSKLIEANAVDAFHINFPDPWWKKRHAKRRLVSTSFAEDLVRCLRPGGEIWIKSDVLAIADEIEDALREQAKLVLSEPYLSDSTPHTHRERRCIQLGMQIYRFRYKKSVD